MVATRGHYLLATSGHHWLPLPITSYHSLWPRAHLSWSPSWLSLYSLSMSPTENITSDGLSIVACVSVAVVMRFGYRGNVFTEPLPICSCVFCFWYSGYQKILSYARRKFSVLLLYFLCLFLNSRGEQKNIDKRSVYVHFDVMQKVIYHYNTKSISSHHMQTYWKMHVFKH
jgi:hypothetical protein